MDNPTALQELAATVAKEELREDQGTRDQSLAQFRDWIDKSPEIRNCRTDDSFLLRFLRVRKFNLPMAQQNLIKFLKVRQIFPYLKQLDLKDPGTNAIISQGVEFVSPFRDEKGRKVIIMNLGHLDSSINNHQDFARADTLNICTLMEDQIFQVLGCVFVVDAAGAGLKQAAIWPPTDLAKYLTAFQTVYPMRAKGLHLVNMHPVVRWFFNLFKSFSTEKMQKRMFVHNSMEELHQTVNPKVLPQELGGDMPMKKMIELWKEHLQQHRETLLGLDNIQLLNVKEDEPKDPDVLGLQGSFRSLSVD